MTAVRTLDLILALVGVGLAARLAAFFGRSPVRPILSLAIYFGLVALIDLAAVVLNFLYLSGSMRAIQWSYWLVVQHAMHGAALVLVLWEVIERRPEGQP